MVNTYWKERRRKEAAFLRKTIEDDSDFIYLIDRQHGKTIKIKKTI